MKVRYSVFLALLTLAWHQTAQAQTASIPADLDNTLYYDTAGAVSNGLGTQMVVGRTLGRFSTVAAPRRGLLRFNVAAFVPPNATIVNAELTMNCSKSINGPQRVYLHRMNPSAEWGEGNSNASSNVGQGAAAAPGDATWLHRMYPDSFWTASGADGDYDSNSSQSTNIVGLGTVTWNTNANMVSDVQHWLDNPTENNGWILKGDEVDSSTTVLLRTREHFSPSDQPTLSVTFLPSVSVSDDGGDRPVDFVLSQNFPNPFNPSTTIAYTLDKAGAVTLAVYDLTGRKVQVLESRVRPAGRHDVTWDGTNESGALVGSGLYFYALNVEGVTITKKMVLIR
jgi:hypothetical protein